MRRCTLLGYVKAYKPELKIKDYELYKGIYCSLCRSLGRLYSPVAQLFLSFDFAFAAVLRLAAGEASCSFSRKRCPYNPTKKCAICTGRDEIDFCAHVLIITVYYKAVDNLHDGGFKSRMLAALIFPIVALMHKKARRLAPEADEIIALSMKNQAQAESKEGVGIDEAAHSSAEALGKVISLGFEGEKAQSLYTLGYMVGRYVYILDAADDLESDLRNGSFNPFRGEYSDIGSREVRAAFVQRVRGMLNLTQSTALDALDALEKKRFEDILENIIFDGLTDTAEKVLSGYGDKKEKVKIYTVE